MLVLKRAICFVFRQNAMQSAPWLSNFLVLLLRMKELTHQGTDTSRNWHIKEVTHLFLCAFFPSGLTRSAGPFWRRRSKTRMISRRSESSSCPATVAMMIRNREPQRRNVKRSPIKKPASSLHKCQHFLTVSIGSSTFFLFRLLTSDKMCDFLIFCVI